MRRTALTFLFSAALALPACGSGVLEDGDTLDSSESRLQRGDVWFTPNVASADLPQLFSEPDRWASARARVGVMQFYLQQLAADEPAQCPSCGNNIFPTLQSVDAFRKLAGWGVAVAFETGAVKHHTCQGERAGNSAADVVDKVVGAGGSVRYIAMDEPYIGGSDTINGQSCRYGADQSAAEVASFFTAIHARHPEVEIGDIEPYPFFRLNQLEAWVDTLARHGVKPAFFHLDVDNNAVKNAKVDVKRDLRDLKSFLAARGIPFGVIFTAHENTIPRGATGDAADRAYASAVMGWVNTVAQAIGAPDQAIFQSWMYLYGQNAIPKNLSDSDASHTKLILDGTRVLGMRDATPAPGPTPTPTPRGDAASIKVAHVYKGVLGRDADAGGLAGWADAVRRGLKTTDLCAGFFNSAEFRTNRGNLSAEDLGAELYRGLLEREPDAGGLAGTVSEIRAGRKAQRCAAMLDSPEFRDRFL